MGRHAELTVVVLLAALAVGLPAHRVLAARRLRRSRHQRTTTTRGDRR